LGIDGLIFIS